MPRGTWDDVPNTPEPEPTLSSLQDTTNDLQRQLKSVKGMNAFLLTLLLIVAFVAVGSLMAPGRNTSVLSQRLKQQQLAIDTLTARQARAVTNVPQSALRRPMDTDSLSFFYVLVEETSGRVDQLERAQRHREIHE